MRKVLPFVCIISLPLIFLNCKKEVISNAGNDKMLATDAKKTTPKVKNNGVKDIDGNKYGTVVINGKEWMAENLKVTHYRNGDPIPNLTDNFDWINTTAGAWCDLANNSANGLLYGKLYNWFAVNDARGLAPAGWHVATLADMEDLAAQFATSENLSQYFKSYFGAGAALKSTGTIQAGTGLWFGGDPATDGTNTSGFNGFPGSHRELNGAMRPAGDDGFWWTSTPSDNNDAFWLFLSAGSADAGILPFVPKILGMSVRCVKD